MKRVLKLGAVLPAIAVCGCVTAQQPLAYLSLEKPCGVIQTAKPREMVREFQRGGWYAFNNNFRPAADLKYYLEQAQHDTNAQVLRNADVQLNVPFAFSILFLGYNSAVDTISVNADAETRGVIAQK